MFLSSHAAATKTTNVISSYYTTSILHILYYGKMWKHYFHIFTKIYFNITQICPKPKSTANMSAVSVYHKQTHIPTLNYCASFSSFLSSPFCAFSSAYWKVHLSKPIIQKMDKIWTNEFTIMWYSAVYISQADIIIRVRTILVIGYWVIFAICRYWIVLLLRDIWFRCDTQYDTDQTAVSAIHMFIKHNHSHHHRVLRFYVV